MAPNIESRRVAAGESSTQITCYTEYVPKQNFTLVVEEDLLLQARKIALERRTSVNQLVRDYLKELVEARGRKRLALDRLKRVFETGLVEVGDWKWTRDELYDR